MIAVLFLGNHSFMHSFNKCFVLRALVGDGYMTEKNFMELSVKTRHPYKRKAANIGIMSGVKGLQDAMAIYDRSSDAVKV